MNPKSIVMESKPLDGFFIRVDTFPLSATWRALIGFLVVPVMALMGIQDRSGWIVVLFLLGFLLTLRVVLAFIRKIIPVSTAVKRVWAERRQMAKRYDSLQWGKLFWIGIGFLSYVLVSHDIRFSRLVVSLICLLSGAAGLIRWRAISSQRESVRESHSPSRNLA